MALSPSRRIFYMKYSSHLPLNYDNPFKITTFIVMGYVCFQYGINAQWTKLSCGYRNAYCTVALPASDEPPISVPLDFKATYYRFGASFVHW